MTPTQDLDPAPEAGPDRRRQRHLATRQEILDTAWALAREVGLAALSLGEVARRVGMRTPSLYNYFASKHAMFDAMFEAGARAHLELIEATQLPDDPRAALRLLGQDFMDFCVADTPRYQLLFQRTIPGYEPSPEAYEPAVRVWERTAELMAQIGITQRRHLELVIAVMVGAVDQKISNERGEQWWGEIVDDVADMLGEYLLATPPMTTP